MQSEEITRMNLLLDSDNRKLQNNVKELVKARVMVEEVDFTEISFWIQIHNLPIDLMTVRNTERIGARLERVIMIDDQWIHKVLEEDF